MGEATAGAGIADVGAAGEAVESARLSPATEEDGAAVEVEEEAFEEPKVGREVDLTAGAEDAGEGVGVAAVGVEARAGTGVEVGVVAGRSDAEVVVEVG